MSDEHKLPGDKAFDQYNAEYAPTAESTARHAFASGWNARRLFDGEPREQFGIFRQQGMLMDGPAYVQIVATSFPSEAEALRAAERIPRLKDVPVVIRRRMASPWEGIE